MPRKDELTPIFTTNVQYLKDLSFESPNAPASLTSDATPSIEVKLDVQVGGFEEDLYEVSLLINIEASNEEGKVFIIEMNYAGLFTVANMGDNLESVLLIDCPTLLFPFARRIISSVSQDGGMPPLMLAPIDFADLYFRKKSEEQEA